MSRRPTIRDVASAVGVSVTTVSHALNDKGRVDAATRERVRYTADRLGYRPDRTALRLRSGRSGTLALLLPSVEPGVGEDELGALDYYLHLAGAATRAAFAAGHPVLLTPPLETADDLHDLGVDGGIVCDPLPEDQRVEFFDALGLPVVTIERDPGHPERPWVVRADNEGNMRALLDHLAATGAERIALLAASGGWGWADETTAAYAGWCAEHGREPLIEEASMRTDERSGYEAALRLLDRARPDAIVSLAERHTNGVLRAATERGLRFPDDLRLAAAVDSHQARDADVTAIDLRPGAQGEAAIALLLERLAGERRDAPLITPSALRVRGSS
ncbi:LacI family DNA-binding transcriptional regulator [Solirubrobacter soli]|uniref:LacI family DNA-binding transcriptional regulator n=1 Tax=Solirubrobacter soli TaxID=363832 RepID=UPI000481DC1D|nr:LacI family DNA-binding transcriptional regulator [Solirubrobacter soli]